MAEGERIDSYLEGLTKPWQKFFKKFEEIETIKVSEWKQVHVLAYMCKRWEKLYGIKFSVTVKGAPSKCPDMYLVKRMIAMLGTDNMKTVKEYVDWVFDDKVIPQKKKIRSFGYFITQGFGNEFHFQKKAAEKIGRDTPIPPEYKSLAEALKVDVTTYGELAFMKRAVEQAPNSESRAPYRRLFEHLKSLGFQDSDIEGIL